MARVAFIVTTCHEFEGVKVLSSVLKAAGHQTDCFITSEERDFSGAVARWRPDVVGIYATTGQEDWARPHVLKWRCELPHLKVVMGGPHPSFDADNLQDPEYVDAITRGESEYAMLDLVEAWSAGRSIAELANVGSLQDGEALVNPIRPAIQDLDTAKAADLDAVILPGGFGAAKVLSNFASEGANCSVDPSAARLLSEMHGAGKPIGAICIAPALVAAALGDRNPILTIGNDEATAQALEQMGCRHDNCPTDSFVIDRDNRIVTTPAYMLGPNIADVYKGIKKTVEAVLEIA